MLDPVLILSAIMHYREWRSTLKKYNCLQALYMSFYSRNLYRDVAENWGGGVILYLLLLILICCSLSVISMVPPMGVSYHAKFENIADQVITQLPSQITLKNGLISTPENRPSKDANKITIQKIPPTLNITVTAAKGREWFLFFVDWFWLLILPFMIVGVFVYRVIQAAFYSVIGMIMAYTFKRQLDFLKIYKLAIISITPTIVLTTFFDWYSRTMTPFYVLLCYFILSMAYIMFAILSNPEKLEK